MADASPANGVPQSLETQADKAIRLLGPKRIAQKCDVTTGAVYKWPARAGGYIPSKHLRAVLELAREEKVDLTAEELIGAAA